jgi:hypothetical protein
MADNVTLSDAIKQLRAELEEAQREGSDRAVRFLAKSVEVELSIVFKSEKEGGGGIKAWFVDLSGKLHDSDEQSHKVKLVLEPVDRGGKPLPVNDRGHEK